MCGSGSVFRIRFRIQKAPEYGSNTDPDPQLLLYVLLVLELKLLLQKLTWVSLENSRYSSSLNSNFSF